MRKTLHRFIVKTTDDAKIDMLRTRWFTYGVYATRRQAWAAARQALTVSHYRHAKIVEERIYSHD